MSTEPAPSRWTRPAAAVVAVVSLASLILQYALLLRLAWEQPGPALGTLRYFSYFTILSNIGVVAVCASAALGRRGFWATARTRAALALYIGVTGLIYVAILRHLWQPQGAQWWADTGLHYATPALYLLWWLACAPHGRVRGRDLLVWLSFPLLYVLWTLLRGRWVGEYPYPFLDVIAHGLPAVLRNSGWVTLLFVVVGLLLWGVDHVLGRWRNMRG